MPGLFDLYNKAAVSSSVPTASRPLNSYHLNKARLDVRQAKERLVAKIAQRDLLEKQLREQNLRKQSAEAQLDTFDKITILLQKTSHYARGQIKGRIEALVSQALNVVYGGNHKFTIDLITRSGRPETDFYLEDNGVITRLEKPDYGRGGGKIDVISLAQRLAVDEMEGDTGPLLLDEVGKHVDGEAAVNLAYFLKTYAEETGRQIILVTHNTALESIGDINIKITKNAKEEAGVVIL